MKNEIAPYNRLTAPKTTVEDYLQSLADEVLETVFLTSKEYAIRPAGLLLKIQKEMLRRNLQPQKMAA